MRVIEAYCVPSRRERWGFLLTSDRGGRKKLNKARQAAFLSFSPPSLVHGELTGASSFDLMLSSFLTFRTWRSILIRVLNYRAERLMPPPLPRRRNILRHDETPPAPTQSHVRAINSSRSLPKYVRYLALYIEEKFPSIEVISSWSPSDGYTIRSSSPVHLSSIHHPSSLDGYFYVYMYEFSFGSFLTLTFSLKRIHFWNEISMYNTRKRRELHPKSYNFSNRQNTSFEYYYWKVIISKQ